MITQTNDNLGAPTSLSGSSDDTGANTGIYFDQATGPARITWNTDVASYSWGQQNLVGATLHSDGWYVSNTTTITVPDNLPPGSVYQAEDGTIRVVGPQEEIVEAGMFKLMNLKNE